MKKNTTKTEEVAPIVKVPKEKKVKTPSFELISYTMKATIPVGQYANICPEVTVKAVSIEAAERAVMPYIETLFARYRDGGMKPTAPAVIYPVATNKEVTQSIKNIPIADKGTLTQNAIVLTAPFNRAKDAINNCTSIEALKLITERVKDSQKLIDSEKMQLTAIILEKTKQLNDKTNPS